MATVVQKTHAFTLILSGVRELAPEMSDVIFAAATRHDATPVEPCNGVVSVDFDREAESLGDAIGSVKPGDVVRAGLAEKQQVLTSN